MRPLALATIVGILIATGMAGWAVAAPITTEHAACEAVKRRIAELRHIHKSDFAFCDMIAAKNSPPGLYVVGLHGRRSKEDCPDMCSTLAGWFAIRKDTGEVGEFDINEDKMMALQR
jgi:hypothetical protein